jgi:tetratricopeptide (TPR) repeat protein
MFIVLTAAPLRADPVPEAPSPAVSADGEEARRLFDLGMALVATRRIEAAVDAFELAYRLKPQYTVLYNLGLAHLELTRTERGVQLLQQYLDEGGDRIPLDRRQFVIRLLADQRVQLNTSSVEVLEPRSLPAANLTTGPQNEPSVGAARSNASMAALATSGVGAQPLPQSAATVPSRALAFTFGGFGLGLVGSGIALSLWNNGNERDVQRGNAFLATHQPPQVLRSSSDLDAASEYRAVLARTEAKSEEVQAFDVVAWSAIGVGAAAVGVGLYFWLSKESTPPQLTIKMGSLHVSGAW